MVLKQIKGNWQTPQEDKKYTGNLTISKKDILLELVPNDLEKLYFGNTEEQVFTTDSSEGDVSAYGLFYSGYSHNLQTNFIIYKYSAQLILLGSARGFNEKCFRKYNEELA